MNTVLLIDTDVFSFIFKEDTRAQLYEHLLIGQVLSVSFMTVAELEHWALRHNWSDDKLNRMHMFLNRFFIQPFDLSLCRVWAEVTHKARVQGHFIDGSDAWIAATALHFGIPLVTHNAKHYSMLKDLSIITKS